MTDQPFLTDNTGFVAALQAELAQKATREAVAECEQNHIAEMQPVTALKAIYALSGYALAEEDRRRQGWER